MILETFVNVLVFVCTNCLAPSVDVFFFLVMHFILEAAFLEGLKFSFSTFFNSSVF